MRAVWLAVGMAALVLQLRASAAQPPPVPAAAPPTAEDLAAQGLALFKDHKYAEAVGSLASALALLAADDPRRADVVLLLGISYYRLGQLDRAEEALTQIVRTGLAEGAQQAAAKVFLSRVFAEQGAPDRARAELGSVAGSPYLHEGAQRLLQQSRPHRLQLTLLVSPEYDGNVPLSPLDTDTVNFPAWRSNPQASMDGSMLFLASIGVRPLASGLQFGNTFSYRQQFRLSDYNLLLDSTFIGYSYLGPADRLRLLTSFNFAMLGGNPLFLDGTAKAAYRRRLVRKLGLSATYDVRYRDYRSADYMALTGLTQSLQLELGWGLQPQPVSFGVAYQAIREQTQVPNPTDPSAQDYRAWAHGPTLWLRARLHKRLELSLNTTFLHRMFESGRVDNASYSDVNLNITIKSWLDAFVGGGAVYNDSSDPLFNYVKPTVSTGLAIYLGLL